MSTFTPGPPGASAPTPFSGAGRAAATPGGGHERRCSRCRLHFDVEARDLRDAWWLCSTCRTALFGGSR